MPEETLNQFVYDLGNGQWDIPALRTLLEEVLPQHKAFDDFEVTHNFPGIGNKVMPSTLGSFGEKRPTVGGPSRRSIRCTVLGSAIPAGGGSGPRGS